MIKRKKKSASNRPKPRHVWKVNPKTRIKKSKKTYSRAEARKQVRKIVKKIDWFGESGRVS